ncbi:hypothetical protein K7432_016168 [Basidiobolus ranarum]|uniref:Chitin-binding type-2 domain-containing protein n=1 Tax=Basidiobolus ranarum TaxID=34480 RepID=A0ABR2VM77_9FUNG
MASISDAKNRNTGFVKSVIKPTLTVIDTVVDTVTLTSVEPLATAVQTISSNQSNPNGHRYVSKGPRPDHEGSVVATPTNQLPPHSANNHIVNTDNSAAPASPGPSSNDNRHATTHEATPSGHMNSHHAANTQMASIPVAKNSNTGAGKSVVEPTLTVIDTIVDTVTLTSVEPSATGVKTNDDNQSNQNGHRSVSKGASPNHEESAVATPTDQLHQHSANNRVVNTDKSSAQASAGPSSDDNKHATVHKATPSGQMNSHHAANTQMASISDAKNGNTGVVKSVVEPTLTVIDTVVDTVTLTSVEPLATAVRTSDDNNHATDAQNSNSRTVNNILERTVTVKMVDTVTNTVTRSVVDPTIIFKTAHVTETVTNVEPTNAITVSLQDDKTAQTEPVQEPTYMTKKATVTHSANVSEETIQPSSSPEVNCVQGQYTCLYSGISPVFFICDNGRMIKNHCADGTVCKTWDNSIICDWN